LEELVIAAFIARISSYEGGVFRRGDMRKLFKLLFLATHGVFDERGRIVGVAARPRLKLKFKVYLFGVASAGIYGIIGELVEKGILRLEDVDTYVLNANADELYKAALDELRERNLELAEVVEVVSAYAGMELHELESFVNGLLGLTDPAVKATFYNADVAKLAEVLERAGKLLERGELVNE